jgi:ferredoxin, 2Fe-2S
MAGANPYVTAADYELPTQPYQITILYEGEPHVITVDPARLPYERSGLPGSVLDICLGHDIPLEHTCGGVIACSTCHVIVKEGLDTCNEPTDDELDQLEEAPGVTLKSRLGCQCVPNGSTNVIIEVPRWNRNAVKETPHEH